jgi:hypothetical protein
MFPMRNSFVFVYLCVVAGCGDDTSRFATDASVADSSLPPLDAPAPDRPDRMAPEVLDLTDVPSINDAQTDDVPCAPSLGVTLTYGLEGGRTPTTERFVLSAPRGFRAERRTGATVSAMCETMIPACNTADEVDVGEVNATLGSRDVEVAFNMARMAGSPRLYGVDTRPFDGQVFAMDLNGAQVVVGEPCRTTMTMGCAEIPVGIQRFVDVLRALRDQELLRTACMSFRKM